MNPAATGSFSAQVLLRTPLYPESRYTEQGLADALGDPRFRNALWLASPAFYRELEKDGFVFTALSPRKQLALRKYFNRCCHRPTPFGAFAAFTSLGWEPGPVIPAGEARLHLLPGREYLRGALPAESGQALRLNPTLYRLGDEYRYIFTELAGGGNERFLLNSLAAMPLHRELFRRWRAQAPDADTACADLCQASACTAGEARDYLDFLRRQQVLLGPAQCGPDAREETLLALLPPPAAAYWTANRSLPFDALLDLPARATGPAGKNPVTGHDTPLFYSALERSAGRGGAEPADQEKLLAACRVLQRLSAPVSIQALQQFIAAFKQRFDQQKVPFLQALDPDSGIPYGDWIRGGEGSAMLDGVVFPDEPATRLPQAWTPQHQLFFQCWLNNHARGPYAPIVLTDALVDASIPAAPVSAMPPSQAILYRSCGDGQLWIESAAGASATALLGRFSAFSDAARQHCRDIAAAEAQANPGVLFAEISQLSETHADNINRRRPVYDTVIPLNVFCDREPGAVLPPDDLQLSVYGEELILESVTRQQRVIPRLPTAYNYTRNQLAPFRLLCDLQHQGLLSDLSVDLERLFPDQVFYPRVAYRDVILSPARWKFQRESYAALLCEPLSISRLHLFREQYGIPRHVCTGLGDQQLAFDLAEDHAARFFLDCLKSTGVLRITEHYPADDRVRLNGQPLAAQFVAAILRETPVYAPLTSPPAAAKVTRDFPPGSNWLYVKLYCTAASADRLLLEQVKPVLQQYRRSYRSWFFIRYAEDGYHLRLRFEGEPEKLARLFLRLARRLQQPALRPLVRDIRTDTYRRELERYDPALIDLAEHCFCAGSAWAMHWLGRYAGERGELAVCALLWLTAQRFLAEAPAIAGFYQAMAQSFSGRYAADKRHRVSLDQKYRALANRLAAALSAEALSVLAAEPCTEAWLKSIDRLAAASQPYTAQRRVNLLADLIHMQVNRLFRSSQLRYEAVLYYCLDKYHLRMRHLKNDG